MDGLTEGKKGRVKRGTEKRSCKRRRQARFVVDLALHVCSNNKLCLWLIYRAKPCKHDVSCIYRECASVSTETFYMYMSEIHLSTCLLNEHELVALVPAIALFAPISLIPALLLGGRIER